MFKFSGNLLVNDTIGTDFSHYLNKTDIFRKSNKILRYLSEIISERQKPFPP